MFYIASRHKDTVCSMFFEHLLQGKDNRGITEYTIISYISYESILEELVNCIPNNDIYLKYSTIFMPTYIQRKNQWIINSNKLINNAPIYYIPISKEKKFKQLLF